MSAPQLRPGDLVRVRDDTWVVHRHVPGPQGSVLEVRGRGAQNRGSRAAFLLPYEPIQHLPSSTSPRVVRPRTWRRAACSTLAAATPSYDSLRSPVHASVAVLPFQLEPVLAIVRGLASRILIADEVGLGKTIQAGLVISELLDRRRDAHVLVVTPAGLRDQWQTELRSRFDIGSTLLDSAAVARHGVQWNGNPWAVPGVVITSLDYVKRPEVVRALESLIWDVLVFDEAHALAGRSDRAIAASVLGCRARTLILLTATPHSGDDQAFNRLASIGDFSGRFPLVVFRRTRLDVGLSSSRRTLSIRVRPTPAESEMHATLLAYARLVWRSAVTPGGRLAMSVLARRACSSAGSLARSVETRLRLLSDTDQPDLLQMALPFGDASTDDEEPGSELSSPGLTDRYEERRWLEHLVQLARRAEAAESKFDALARFLRRAREPAIVFTEYRDTLHRLANHLRGMWPVLLHGGLTAGERQDALRRFVAGDVSLLLATDAASEGLNLHHRCRLVVNLELPWTPVRLEQRIGRVERIGQKRRVHAVHLLAAGTCEEESVAVLLERMRHVTGVLNGMRAAPLEQQIAAVALSSDGEQADLKVHSDAQPLPRGVAVGDLRSAAREEATRLECARALVQGAGHAPPNQGPIVTVFARHRTRSCWVYRLVFEDANLQPVWDTVIGIDDDLRPVPRMSSERRLWLESFEQLIEPVVAGAAQRLLSSLRSDLDAPLVLAIDRERAIAEDLELQQARLATSVLQPGLFDRRTERAAAAQNATLDEALSVCARRLAELTSRGQLSLDRPRLAIGVIRR